MNPKSILVLTLGKRNDSTLWGRVLDDGVVITKVSSIREVQKELVTSAYSLLLCRIDGSIEIGFEILAFIGSNEISTPVILNIPNLTVEDAVRLMKAGAEDVVVGESADSRLIESVRRCLHKRGDVPESPTSDARSCNEMDFSLIGQSPAICEIRSAVELVAKSQTNVLISGESGTGKEVVARLIHMQSNRAAKPFVAVNCAALPKDVIENELFGHEKGAFTGSVARSKGCFELANEGTIFLDEVAEMSTDTQAKLLRAIELQVFRKLGGKAEVSVDVRTIAATNRNISTALKARELREDLYYRLSVIEIFIPPLRERKEDIAVLVEYFLSMFAEKYGKEQQRFSERAMESLLAYDWPGNVRELRNVIERAVVICSDEMLDQQYLPERICAQGSVRTHITIPLGSSTQEAERLVILHTLASVGNNKSKAAKILGVSRKTLHNKLASFVQ